MPEIIKNLISPMKIIFIVFLIAGLYSCKKDNYQQNNADIILSKKWYPFQVHLISYNNNTNAVVKDTTFLTQSCAQQSTITFLPDSLVKRAYICDGIPVKEGKWYVTADSISASINVPMSYGTGVIYYNIGINKSKLLEIDQSHFIAKETNFWFGMDGSTGITTHYRDEILTTYKSQ